MLVLIWRNEIKITCVFAGRDPLYSHSAGLIRGLMFSAGKFFCALLLVLFVFDAGTNAAEAKQAVSPGQAASPKQAEVMPAQFRRTKLAQNSDSQIKESAPVSPDGNKSEGVGSSSEGSEPDARRVFADKKTASAGPPRSIGQATCGCLGGAVKLPADGPGWQVMRPSRNRFWGHPTMVEYVEKLGRRVPKVGWNGLLVGDMSMPRGGPMPSGHASHQRGTDVDIWLTQAPAHKLTEAQRESLSAGSVLKIDSAELDMSIWTPAHANFVRTAAQDDNVARIFVTPAIKKYLCSCKSADGSDAVWLRRLRPWEGHDDHIHVRLKCPPGEPCVEQDPPPDGDGCGEELSDWMKKTAKEPPYNSKPAAESEPYKPYPLSKMPQECIDLLNK